jgi:hypothetical protein
MSAIVRSAEYNDAAFKSSRNYECVTTKIHAEAIINSEKCKQHFPQMRALLHAAITTLDNAYDACVHHDATLSCLEGVYDAASAAADGDYECDYEDEDKIVVVERDHATNHAAACAAYDAYVVADNLAYDARHNLWYVIENIKRAIKLYIQTVIKINISSSSFKASFKLYKSTLYESYA